jgi:hypothetical protein
MQQRRRYDNLGHVFARHGLQRRCLIFAEPMSCHLIFEVTTVTLLLAMPLRNMAYFIILMGFHGPTSFVLGLK